MDGGQAMAPEVHQIDPAPQIRALSTLAVIDYADAFVVTGGPAGKGTPDQWAHAVLVRSPLPVRVKLVAGWTMLGLRLGFRPPGQRVLGWRARQRTPEHLLLGAGSSPGGAADVLFRPEPGRLL